jgi:hypothetical protein
VPRSQRPSRIAWCARGSSRRRPSTAPKNSSATATVLPGGRVDHGDAQLGGHVHRHVVDAHPRAPDHLEAARGPQQVGGDLGRRPADDGVVVARPLEQGGGGERRDLVDAQPRLGLEQGDAVAVDVVGDEDAEHGGGDRGRGRPRRGGVRSWR